MNIKIILILGFLENLVKYLRSLDSFLVIK